jgi:hypothetical protein
MTRPSDARRIPQGTLASSGVSGEPTLASSKDEREHTSPVSGADL